MQSSDPSSYFSNAGYSQIPQSSPYQYNQNYTDTSAPWANADTYAPWEGESGMQMAQGFHQDGTQNSGMNKGLGGAAGLGSAAFLYTGGDPIAGLLGAGVGGLMSLFGGKGKRPHYTYTAPSYQGTSFMPQEGLPQYYQPSSEGQAQNQTQQQAYQGQPQSQQSQSMQSALNGTGYDYNYGGSSYEPTDQAFIGQQNQSYGSFYGGQNPALTKTYNPTGGF